MKLFGFDISRTIEKNAITSGGIELDNTIQSFAIPSQNDGTMLLPSASAAGYYGQILDIDGTSFVNEKDLILKYRAAAGQPECDNAISDITNAAIISDSKGAPVKLDLDTVELPQKVKERIFEEFSLILQLLDFNFTGYDIFRRWYIDGKIYFHLQIDSAKSKEGIKGIIQIEPLKIKKIKEVSTTIDRTTGMKSNQITAEYFLYSDDFSTSTSGVKIDPNAIVYVPSGVLDESGKVAISYLHKSIKLVNQLRMMEDALVIYRVARAPERRIFYIDVGNLPKGKAEEYVQGLIAKYRNKLVYSQDDGTIRDDRKSMCLTMDTKVPLLDGRTLSLSEITEEYNNGKQLWVYSCDPVTGKFAPGLVSWAGVTRKDTDVMRLTLDNGKTITCTLDHKFPVWNKGFVRADKLIVGESMIPFYTREEKVMPKSSKYHQHFDNSDKKWVFTHRAVSSWKDNNLLENEWVYDESFVNERKSNVHHKNYNRYNNSPENLVRMNYKDHFKYHQILGGDSLRYKTGIHGLSHEEICINAKLGSDALLAKFNDSEFYAALCAKQKAGWVDRDDRRLASAERGKARPIEHFQHMNVLANESRWGSDKSENNRKKLSDSQRIEYPENISTIIEKALRTKVSVADILIHINDNIDHESWKNLNTHKVVKLRKSISPFTHKDLSKLCKLAGFKILKDYKEALLLRNHKIVNIEYLKETIDTGCLTVDGDEIYHDYHTFALDAGIYTKNSILEDFFLPRREGCVHLNTSIKLLDGRDLPLIDLIQEYNEGKQNWVYSVSPDGTIVPGKISWAGITRRNTEVLNVYLDNGEVVTATPDHKFILRTGEKIEAKDLVLGDVLSTYAEKTRDDAHKADDISKSVIRVEYLSDKIDVGTLTIDENHDYHDYHNFALSSGIFVMNSKGTEITTLPGGCLAMDTKVSLLDGRELSISDIESELSTGKQLWTYSCDEFTGEVKPGLISWAGQTQANAEVMKITLDNGESLICTPDHKFPVYGQGFVAAEDLSPESDIIEFTDKGRGYPITNIEYLDYTIPVGTLTIDKDELIHNHHTFALSCGIFTKNSNLSEIEDINFFQKKLYRSLNVPSSRLEADSLFTTGRSSEISREEVKFQKFISRLRKKFSMMFADMLRVQCILKGIITAKDWPMIREGMGIDFIEDNFYSELKDAEILKSRLEVLEQIQPSIGIYYSNKWIRSNVLNMSEHDVARMKEEMDEEKAAEASPAKSEEEPPEEAGGEEEPEVGGEEEPAPEAGEKDQEWDINLNKNRNK